MKKKELKILLLEDSSADAELLQRHLLRHGLSFTCRVVDTRTDFIESLKTFVPHLILSDHSLPQFNSVEAMKIARRVIPGIPFILVTGAVSDEFAVDIIKRGADDYILKDKLARLPSAIESALKHSAIKKEKKQILEELIKREQQLKKKVEELNMFIYQLSHNIRGPVSTVKGLLYIATKGRSTVEELDSYLHMLNRSVNKLDNTLISLIRAVETIESPLKIKKVDLLECIEEVCEQLKTISGYDRICFDIDIRNRKPFYSDKEKFSTVLKNIIENSIIYQNRNIDQPCVAILAEDSGNGIKLTVEDNGVGIPENWHFKVFDMFTRASTSSTGSGLGLYIAKSIMEKLHGSVHLESELEKGTTISIILDNMKS